MSKSPRRYLRPSPGELQRKLEEEREKRRRARLLQVRSQSRVRSSQILAKVSAKTSQEKENLGKRELINFTNSKLVELEALNNEYQGCLVDVGMGIRQASEREKERALDLVTKARNEEIAKNRGIQALKENRYNIQVDKDLIKNKIAVKESVALTEKLRSARVINRRNKVSVVELSDERSASPHNKENQVGVIRRLNYSSNKVNQKIVSNKKNYEDKIEKAKKEFINAVYEIPPKIVVPDIESTPVLESVVTKISTNELTTTSSDYSTDTSIFSPLSYRSLSSSTATSTPAPVRLKPQKNDIDFVSNVIKGVLPLKYGIKIDISEHSSSSLSFNGSELIKSLEENSCPEDLKRVINVLLGMKRSEIDDLSSLTESSLTHSSSATLKTLTETTSSSSSFSPIKKPAKSVHFSPKTPSLSEGAIASTSSSEESESPSTKVAQLKDKIFKMKIPTLTKKNDKNYSTSGSSKSFNTDEFNSLIKSSSTSSSDSKFSSSKSSALSLPSSS